MVDLSEGKGWALETSWIAVTIVDSRMEVEKNHNGFRDMVA